jgi:hypothetical protein
MRALTFMINMNYLKFFEVLFLVYFSVIPNLSMATVLVSYSFDDERAESGPDTFQIFQNAKGTVRLSMDYRYSGFYSVEIKDVAGDRDFPELQGYFPRLDRGTLSLHFALLTTDASETLNIALAGPKWFNVTKDGIGFWLTTKNGYLYHVSEGIPKKLLLLNSFYWYTIDVAYHIDKGIYDLIIYEEGKTRPVVHLSNQPNTPNQLHSSVDKFSFIGDLSHEDKSNVLYYVDDVVVATQTSMQPAPFVAPGRRKLFVDLYNEYQVFHGSRPQCLPIVTPADVGVGPPEIAALKRDGLLQQFVELLTLKPIRKPPSPRAIETHPVLHAVSLWHQGCNLLKQKEADKALGLFESASSLSPDARIFRLSSVLALAMARRWDEVNLRLAIIYVEWAQDIRLAAAQALIGLEHGDFDNAELILRYPADLIVRNASNTAVRELWGDAINQSVIDNLKHSLGNSWRRAVEDRFVAERYFFILLWKGWFNQALQYATDMVARLKTLGLPTALWLEHAGDAAFFMKDYPQALAWYEEGLRHNNKAISTLLKLSDVHFVLGNFEAERKNRESIYGSLRPKSRSLR